MTRMALLCVMITCLSAQPHGRRANAAEALPTGLGGKPQTYESIIQDMSEAHSDYQAVGPADEVATLDLDDLLRGQLEWRGRIKNALVRYMVTEQIVALGPPDRRQLARFVPYALY